MLGILLQKESVLVVAIQKTDKCVKMKLPNGKTVDILADVFSQISRWLQVNQNDPESGGYILGYRHIDTDNISLEYVTCPQPLDIRSRTSFRMRDPKHKIFLLRGKISKSYYMGLWHTHPQERPTPSGTDWEDWNDTLRMDRTACNYIFFIIAGTNELRVWAGDSETKRIDELLECAKEGEIYA